MTPSEVYNLPIIGKIYVQLTGVQVNGQAVKSSMDEYDVIKVLEQENGKKTYLCNVWNSPDIAQLVPDIFVIRFEEK
jgi:hypothetical protein